MFSPVVRKIKSLLFPGPSGVTDLSALYQIKTHRNTIYLLPYKQETVRRAIKNTKYHSNRSTARLLATYLDLYIYRFATDTLTIVPIPQSYTRWRERGFDHLDQILQYSQFANHVNTKLLQKSRHTKRQAHVDRETRKRQQAGSFSCRPAAAAQLTGTVILFDDVITTGATMEAARAALAPHLPRDTRLICLAIAH